MVLPESNGLKLGNDLRVEWEVEIGSSVNWGVGGHGHFGVI